MGQITKWLRGVFRFFLAILIPQFCAGCKKEREIFCSACSNRAYQRGARCFLCGARNQTGALCPESCRKKFLQIFGGQSKNIKIFLWAGRYEQELKTALWQLKYKRRAELAGPLGTLLVQKFHEIMGNVSATQYVVVPVPLHPLKEKERKFNQALLLAQEFSQKTGAKLASHILTKTQNTRPQVATATKEERLKNLEHAFTADESALEPFNTKTVILIDDVATTGATLAYAARAMITAGAQQIICLVVAHD